MIFGVSAWFGDKIGVEERYVRLGFFISIFIFGIGLGLYLALWIVKLVTK